MGSGAGQGSGADGAGQAAGPGVPGLPPSPRFHHGILECDGLLNWIKSTFKSPYIYHDLAPWGIIDRSKGVP